ncbi:DUF927 domain-containing protein [Halanaerobium sp. ST460_2HS_T2]|uniref:DUF927 domain-containing protein n=1 Tax=Halanaerobium sp. ST460_2HS_T2 TaxID=2183914 RepID=UPI000DF40BF4|nr:DUF927 domain-containing protein [Halanaerobium sp. ST460_2HS_T2]RCW58580.1 uncharacterized protein DUF927 [Halanaerobium sp. ST460_2HS_T2]
MEKKKPKIKNVDKDKAKLMEIKKLNPGIFSKNGYIVRGIKGDYQIIARDIKVRSIKEVLETGNEFLELEIATRNNNRKNVTIPRELFGNKRKLSEVMVAQGADVYEHNSKDVIKHLVNQEIKTKKNIIHHSLGWGENDEDKLYFKHFDGIGIKSKYDGDYDIEPKGDLKDYLQLIKNEVIGNRKLELAFTIGFTSAVIGLIGRSIEADSMSIHIFGESTTGKTTAAQLATSVWGNPSRTGSGLLRDWNSTQNALIAELRNNTGVTVAFDEASMANLYDFTNTIYKLASGRDKSRLNRDAQMKETATWYTTIISTGEHALTTKSNNNIGLLMRVIEIGDITWTNSGAHADRIKHGVTANYGLVGPLFAEDLIVTGKEEIINLWSDEQQKIFDYADEDDRFQHRMANKLAIITTTAILVNECFEIELDVDAILDLLFEAEKTRLPDRDLSGRAYDYLMEQVAIASRKNFNSDYGGHIGKMEGANYSEFWGKKIMKNGKNELVIFPSIFEKLMNDGGFEEPQSILRKWKEQDVLNAEKDRLTRRRKIGGSRTPVHVIKIKDDEDDEDEEEVKEKKEVDQEAINAKFNMEDIDVN